MAAGTLGTGDTNPTIILYDRDLCQEPKQLRNILFC